MSRKLALRIAPLFLALNAIGFAQVEQGAITGVVIDATGAVDSQGQSLRHQPGDRRRRRHRNHRRGLLQGPYLAAGKYKLAVEKDGFTTNRVNDVPVLVGQIATINVTMKTGQRS